MPVSQHTIAGTVLTMPVRIRTANMHSAMFSVPTAPTQKLIDYSGLTVCEYLPGKAIVMQMLVRYVDGDLGQYHEYGTAVMVNPPGSRARQARGPRALTKAAAFIHHLPVDQSFTLEAGRTIWGFPKIMADFNVREGAKFGFDVSADGQLIADMEFSNGVPLPTRGSQVLKAYSHQDGVTREIPWEMKISGLRARVGGARLRLGDHPYAKELASLGLPKRALASQSAANVEMTFGDAHAI
ncbi:acetoacetate decarboxylase family protein [Mycobacterium persicum]|uniref:Acetoacetate decarboxylase n=1 Tax=Mycobacterium persicum TaxID=1487726 RepID=A0A1X0L7Y5_9MYCO|nr:acetoacetate decarboxylase family protein [Mycobacterium persicum]KZS80630.1 acetoacetate decarboxylase [Mycobacterium persicum]ORB33905.1 acetoacetate decarboxylase [Mycobacterium persicum]ORB82374.1 acetoacetate decarboxylase [Mycobacterium persicum]ORB89680.1 acetoacetate decarboxylase [Mycobacterium persicum]ORC01866.1 acetoacetate decarboxylase [Mycobacterium persicum]